MVTSTSSVFGEPDPTPSQDTGTPVSPPEQDETKLPLVDQINEARSRAQSTQDRLEQAEEELEQLDKENQDLHDTINLIIEPMKASAPKHYKDKDWKEIITEWAEWYGKVQNTINWNVSSPEEAARLDRAYSQYLKLDLIKAIAEADDEINISDIVQKYLNPEITVPFEEPGEQR